MTAVVVLLCIVLISLLITYFSAAVLMATGLSRQYARFQARSAFTGVGFTTSEAEKITNHPVRRRVVAVLMVLGNAGIATAIATLLVGFEDSSAGDILTRSAVLIGGLTLIWALATNRRVEAAMTRGFQRLIGSVSDLELRDYAGILKVGRDFTVGEMAIHDEDWLAGRTLSELSLRDEGVIVLGIERDGEYSGTPGGESRIEPGDTLVLYGRSSVLRELDRRRPGIGGELAHVDRVAEYRRERRQDRDEAPPAEPAGQD